MASNIDLEIDFIVPTDGYLVEELEIIEITLE